METAPSPAFWELARQVRAEAGRHGLVAPGFRSPPRLPGATRTIRRYPGGAALVSVERRGRATSAVVTDMVEGLLVANGITGPAAQGWRDRLGAALAREGAREGPRVAGERAPGSGG